MSAIGDALDAARWKAARTAPYLARGLYALQFTAEERVPTFAVDEHFRCYYNPAYAEKCLAAKTLISAIVHECLHPTLKHASRAKCIGVDVTDPARKARWNICTDFEINGQIEAMKLPLGKGWMRAEQEHASPTDSAEEHYHRTPKSEQSKQCSCSGGSGAGTGSEPWEGPRLDAPGLSPAEAEVVRVSMAAAMRDANERKPGSVPGGMLRWAEQYGTPAPVDWRAMLTANVRRTLDTRRGYAASYDRPSRRVMGPFILPVHRTPRAKVCIVLDTSGSMEDDDMGKCLTCVVDALQVLGRVTAVACDAAASEPIEIMHIDDLRPFLAGGGGTDMPVGIQAAADSAPDAIVVVTDGETSWPSEEPPVPCTVVLTRRPYAMPPEWATVIEVPPQ